LGGADFVKNFFLFYLLSAVSTSYGYLVNDLGDRELDKIHGKKNIFHGDTTLRAVLVVLFFFVSANFLAMPFFRYKGFLPLWFLWLFLTTAYSLPPFRFKEKGALGLIAVVPAQRVIPALQIFSIFGGFPLMDGSILLLYVVVGGILSDVRHQIEDISLDSQTGTMTFVNKVGVEKSKKIYSFFLAADLIMQLLVYACAVIFLPVISIAGRPFPLALPLLIVYMVAMVGSLFRGKGIRDGFKATKERDISHFLHALFPAACAPLYLIVMHCMRFHSSLSVLLFFLIIKNIFSPARIKGSYIGKLFGNAVNGLKKIIHFK